MSDPITNKGLAAPVERLVLVDEIERIQTGPFHSQSLPGHLVHIVTAGKVSQWAEGRAETFGPGAVVWYHDNELIRGKILRAPWRFITINFLAPALPPPRDDYRVFRASAVTLRLGHELLALWRDRALSPLERQLNCHRALIELLQRILRSAGLQTPPQPGAQAWWRIEKRLRARLDETHTLATVHQLSGLSTRTIVRVCRAATGLPPMKRLREMRLGYAHGLLQHSDLPITEIALRIGYARPQEFSRDYRKRFGLSPREDRRRSPSYLQLQRPTDDEEELAHR
jgi:AraC-like DNA-binding protein